MDTTETYEAVPSFTSEPETVMSADSLWNASVRASEHFAYLRDRPTYSHTTDYIAISECILDGQILRARQLISHHFPAVLNMPDEGECHHPAVDPDTSSAPMQPPSRDAGSGQLDIPALTSRDATTTSVTLTEKVEALAHSCPVSLDPRHLMLNLRIQEFIESLRTVPLTRTERSPTTSLEPAAPPKTGRTPVFSHNHSHSASDDSKQQLLEQGQQLWCLMSELPSASDKVLYMNELQNVGALYVYDVPETCPVGKYMSMERREAIAEQVNCAILCAFAQFL